MAAKDNRSQERRRYERFDIQLPVEAVFSGNGMERVIRSRSVNICAGGAFFPSAVEFTPGTRLSLRIEAPTGALSSLFSGSTVDSYALLVIKTECEIVHSTKDSESPDDFGLGVKFGGPMRIAPKALEQKKATRIGTVSSESEFTENDLPSSNEFDDTEMANGEGSQREPGMNPASIELPDPSN